MKSTKQNSTSHISYTFIYVLIVAVMAFLMSGCTLKSGIVRFWQNGGTSLPVTGETAGTKGNPETKPPSNSFDVKGRGSNTTSSSGKDGSNDDGGNGAKLQGVWIDVSISNQEVRVLKGDEVLRRMTASTGMEGHETPLGTFEIQNRGTWFYSEKYKQGAKYWVSFKDWGVYLFHSLAMDKNQKVIPEEADKLGKPASHGCIRLSIEDAKWIYDNIPAKTKVVIHK